MLGLQTPDGRADAASRMRTHTTAQTAAAAGAPAKVTAEPAALARKAFAFFVRAARSQIA